MAASFFQRDTPAWRIILPHRLPGRWPLSPDRNTVYVHEPSLLRTDVSDITSPDLRAVKTVNYVWDWMSIII